MSHLPPRLRHTFKYPSSESSPSPSRDELDEEEQESLLSTLSTSATRHDCTYRLIFTALPLLATLPFLYQMTVNPSRSTALPTVLALTSLGITAYSMGSVRLDEAMGKAGKRPSTIFARPDSGASASALAQAGGPLMVYLPWLNAAIALLLLLLSFLLSNRTDRVSQGFWVLLLLPAVMLGVVTVVRGSMVEIQSGLGELRGLRYEYKGA